jgi:hypothetical protein
MITVTNNAINKNMEEKIQETAKAEKKQPDERSGIHVQGHIKIFDPQTKEVFVNGRA